MTTQIPASDFHNVLSAALLHASTDEIRPHMCSVLMRARARGEQCAIVATDGHRLIEIFRPWEIEADLLISRDDVKRVLA